MTAPTAKPRAELDNITAAWVTTYADTTAKIKHFEELRARAREHIEAAMGDAEEAVHDGHVVARYTVVQSSRIDTKKLAESHPEIAEAFRVPQTTRRFSLPDGA